MNQPKLESDFPKPSGPLQGVRVLELAHIMAGPVCGLMLADLGADVIKVEKMPGGDDTRRMIPPKVGEESAAFMMMNRNKRGVAVNLKQEQGKEILRKLVAEADVLIENYRHDTMKKLGLGYDELKQINPGLVYCEISGFGRSGPFMGTGRFRSDRPGHERFDEHHRGGTGTFSGESRRAADRHHCRNSWSFGCSIGFASKKRLRPGTKGRYLPF